MTYEPFFIEWCGFCDAITRTGMWMISDEPNPAHSCPECGAGWISCTWLETAPTGIAQ